jgi:lysozyme
MKHLMLGALLIAGAGCTPGHHERAAPPPILGNARERSPADRLGSADEAVHQCPKREGVRGVDVSYYQGRVDWPAARAHGIAFAFARVADGRDVRDPAFAANWAGMKAAGVIRGAYHFFRPAQDPLAQAAAFLREVEARGGLLRGDLPPALDLEVSDGVPPAVVRARAKAWLARVEAALGRTPIVYTSPGFWEDLGADAAFGRYTLWLAHWETPCPALPGVWSRFRFWQDATDRAVPGIAAPVDTDWFDGTRAELERFAGGRSAPAAQPKSPARAQKAPVRPRGGRRKGREIVDLGRLLRVLF